MKLTFDPDEVRLKYTLRRTIKLLFGGRKVGIEVAGTALIIKFSIGWLRVVCGKDWIGLSIYKIIFEAHKGHLIEHLERISRQLIEANGFKCVEGKFCEDPADILFSEVKGYLKRLKSKSKVKREEALTVVSSALGAVKLGGTGEGGVRVVSRDYKFEAQKHRDFFDEEVDTMINVLNRRMKGSV